jgi:hypothetical protein
VDDELVPPEDVGAALKDIHALVGMMTHGEDTPKHLQDARASIVGGRGTATVSRAGRNSIRRRRVLSPDRNLSKSKTKRFMCDVLHTALVGHRLDHAHNVGSESTRSERVDRNDTYLIHDVVKSIEVLILHDGVKQVPLKGRYGIGIANPRPQSLPHHPMDNSNARGG